MKFHILLSALLLLSACAPKSSETQFSYDNSSADVHYEPVNAQGTFLDHQVIEDPMRSTYEQGVWEKSNESSAQTMGVDTSVINRVNIVFVGDGYTSSQLAQYKKDVDSNIERLSLVEPFKNYLDYFRFHRVDVVSKESGVSQEVKGKAKDTALGMSFYCGGIQRLLCINANKAMKEAQNAPKVDSVFALANTSVYGGAGYRSPAISTLAARNPSALELALHEFAHSFAALADEYDYQGSSDNCAAAANVSAKSRTDLFLSKSKWFRWLDVANVGAYKGSCYSLNYYRPTENSKMRSLGRPFEPVNAEQMVISIYKRVRPVEFATKEGTLKGQQVIEARAMKPSSHKLSIVWTIDSKEIAALKDSETFDSLKLGLVSGKSYKISVRVVDRTPAVRDEDARSKYMTQILNWKLKL